MSRVAAAIDAAKAAGRGAFVGYLPIGYPDLQTSIDAAVAAGVRRYVMVSYFGAGPDHGIDPDDGFYAYAEAKAAADAHLRASGLDVTIIAPSALTLDEPTGRIDTTAERSASVSRADVAAVIAAAVLEPATIGRTIRFNSGPTPIAEAIRA